MKLKPREISVLKLLNLLSRTGVDRISVGSITHSAPGIDFKLEF